MKAFHSRNYIDNRICSAKMAGILDNRIRRWFQNPLKILAPYVKPGMMVLDVGCGPGYFTLPLAQLVGPAGRVIAADLQPEMLEIVKRKIQDTELTSRVILHQTAEERIGVIEPVDFILTFYMLHEVINQAGFLSELKSILKPDGRFLLIEPKIHVSKKDFASTIQMAQDTGFIAVETPKVFMSRSRLMK
jgi:ubiquinone/menaquinone biosynthesis C-methylase UbiE